LIARLCAADSGLPFSLLTLAPTDLLPFVLIALIAARRLIRRLAATLAIPRASQQRRAHFAGIAPPLDGRIQCVHVDMEGFYKSACGNRLSGKRSQAIGATESE